MVRRFFRDSAIYFVPAVVSSGISFFLFPFYAHHFTPRQYGAFDLLTLTGMLVGWTVALEIYQGVGRYVAGETDTARATGYASTALWFAVGAYAVFALVVELFAEPVARVLLGAGASVSLLRIAVAWMSVQGILAIAQAQLRWQLRPVAFTVGALINAIITVVASAALVFGAGLEVEGAIAGQLIGSTLALVYVLAATRGTFRLHFDRRRCREMLAFSAPLVPSSVGVFLNLYADRLVIQHVRSLYDVGLYGVGYRLAMIVALLLTGIQGAAMPLILSRKDDRSTPADLARILQIVTALSLATFVAVTILATPALRVLAAPEYQSASSVVPFLVLSVAFANMYVFAPGMSIAKKTLPMTTLTVIAGAANLGLALLLVRPFGIVGAGIATASTSFAWFIAIMVASQRHYAVPHHWRQLCLALVCVTTFVTVSLVLLPASRAGALSPATLLIRCLLVLGGIGLSVRAALGHGAIRVLGQQVRAHALPIRFRQRRPTGVAQT